VYNSLSCQLLKAYHCADGLALDRVAGNLYWTDAAEHHIEVVDPEEPRNRKILLTTGDSSIPRAIVVDPHEG